MNLKMFNEFPHFCFSVNDMREDYDLGHTFDAAALKHYKVNSGSVVVFYPERFYTKYEQKYTTFNVKVRFKSE